MWNWIEDAGDRIIICDDHKCENVRATIVNKYGLTIADRETASLICRAVNKFKGTTGKGD